MPRFFFSWPRCLAAVFCAAALVGCANYSPSSDTRASSDGSSGVTVFGEIDVGIGHVR